MSTSHGISGGGSSLALENTAAQRRQLDARAEEQARKRAAVQAADAQQAKGRAEWLAREKERAALLDAQKKRREAALAVRRENTTANATARPPRERSAAFRKAQVAADKKRAQLEAPRRTAPQPAVRMGGLTREEKRRKRIAQEIGVSYRRTPVSQSAPAKPSTSAQPAAPAIPGKRAMTAREQFIAEERRRKQEKATKAPELDEDSDVDEDEEELGPSHSSLRNEIWGLFGKNRENDDDMEAGAGDVLQEEMRSARVGRDEDEREEAMLEAHRRAKLRRSNVP